MRMSRLLACWGAVLASGLAAQSPMPEPDVQDAKAHRALGVRLKAAIDAGHDWLKQHQEADGSFSASAFVVHDPRGKPTDGPGKPDQDVFVTALVITSWSGMGWLPDGAGEDGEGTHPHVCRATQWLFSQVREDGSIGMKNSTTLVRDTGVAAEVLHWAGIYYPDWAGRLDADKTVAWLAAARLPDGRWPKRIGGPRDWATDMFVASCLAVVGGGLDDAGPFALGNALRPGTAAEAGGAAYIAAWSAKRPALRTAACAAALRELPRPHERSDGVDYLGWYGATQGMQFEDVAAWRRWWHALCDTALEMQRTDGSFAGSWDPLDVRGRECGRIYSTACMLIALEVAWRKEYRDR